MATFVPTNTYTNNNNNNNNNNKELKISEPQKISENVYNFQKNNNNSAVHQTTLGRKKNSICFATMCKNEEHCIQETLESVYKYIDYWVVCDTGSTDRTCEIVQSFFDEKGIPGELFVDEWKGFDYNKTLLFDRCYKKAEYIMHLDADDLLVGDFSFTEDDAGMLNYFCWCKRGESSNVKFKVLFMYNNNYHWKFCGVAHTTIKCLDCNDGLQEGYLTHQNFYLNSRDTGNRSNDPEKYYKDALKLQEQFFNTLIEDPDFLNARSVFYTAQSYRDARKYKEAAQWYALYTKLKENVSWNEEAYISWINLGKILSSFDERKELVIRCFESAMKIIPDRAEAQFELGKYYNHKKMFEQSYNILVAGYAVNLENAKKKYRLFVNEMCYGKFILDELSVSCYWMKKYVEGKKYLMQIIHDPDFANDKTRLETNLQFFDTELNR
jgi:glycosyltransferase involved in cell wall biosynthesis